VKLIKQESCTLSTNIVMLNSTCWNDQNKQKTKSNWTDVSMCMSNKQIVYSALLICSSSHRTNKYLIPFLTNTVHMLTTITFKWS